MNGSSRMGLKDYNKDVPPGWKPGSYPLKEYLDHLEVWGNMTSMEASKIGPAIISRLEEGAFRLVRNLTIERYDENRVWKFYEGMAVVTLPRVKELTDPTIPGVVLQAEQPSGSEIIIQKLMEFSISTNRMFLGLHWTSSSATIAITMRTSSNT